MHEYDEHYYIVYEIIQKHFAFENYKPTSLLGGDNFLTAYDNERTGIHQPFTTVSISFNGTSDKYVTHSNMLTMMPW